MSQTPLQPPDGIRMRRDGETLTLRFKEDTRVGMGLIMGAAMAAMAVAYIVVGGSPSTGELVGASIVCAALLFLGVANLVNSTTVSVDDEGITFQRGPVSLRRRVQLSASGLERIQVEPIKHTSSSGSVHYTYALGVVHESVGSKRLVSFGTSKVPAEFVCKAVRARLGLQTSSGNT